MVLTFATLMLAGCSADPASVDQSPPAAVSSMSDSPSESATPVGSDGEIRSEIRSLLSRRAAAMESGDLKAFLADISPGQERSTAKSWFRQLGKLPVRSVTFELGNRRSSGVEEGQYVTEVVQSVQLGEGFDPAPIPIDHVFEFVRQDGDWKVKHDSADDSTVSAEPWRLPNISFLRSRNCLIAYPSKGDRFGRTLHEACLEVIHRLDTWSPYQWRHRAVVVLDESGDLISNQSWVSEGVRYPVSDDLDRTVMRVVVRPEIFDGEFEGVVRSLGGSVIADAQSADDISGVPAWLLEGTITYILQQGPAELTTWEGTIEAAEQGRLDSLPDSVGFYRGDPEEAYGIAVAATTWLARVHGEDAPFELIDACRARGCITSTDENRVLKATFGISSEQLAREAQSLILRTYGSAGTAA